MFHLFNVQLNIFAWPITFNLYQNGRMELLDSGLYSWSLKTASLEIFSTLKFVDKFLVPLEVSWNLGGWGDSYAG
jgi:hypothetical protein